MRLNSLTRDIQFIQLILPKNETDITGINIDSRQVKKGDMFIAMRGTQVDGHKYIATAEEQGAAAIVCETLPEHINPEVAYLKVADSQAVAGKLATTFYGDPTQKLKLVGVTGTNGKTTIATLLYELFREMGHKCGLLSTVCNYIDGTPYPSTHTTPDVVSLNALLGKMADEGCEYAFMEVSSHSLAQERVGGLRFAGGIFTNLTRDHIDYHNTMEEYLRCKKSFFDKLPSDAFAITNIDDKNGPVMVQNTRADIKKYSARTMGDYKGRILETHLDGMLLEFNRIEFTTQLTFGNIRSSRGTGQRAAGGAAHTEHTEARVGTFRNTALERWLFGHCRLRPHPRRSKECAEHSERSAARPRKRHHRSWSRWQPR